MLRFTQIVGVLMSLIGVSHSDTECHLSERYCPGVGCIDILYRCDGCLWQQIKCADGSCKYSYESCPEPEEGIVQDDCPNYHKKCPNGKCVRLFNSCVGPCKIFEVECEDGRCLNPGKSCDIDHSMCSDHEKACPAGHCVSLWEDCHSPNYYDVDIDIKMCAVHDYQCSDGRCVPYQTECFKTTTRGFYFYVTLPVFMVSLVLSLMCRHCKREARNARLAAYAAAANANASQQQPFFRRLQSMQTITPGDGTQYNTSTHPASGNSTNPEDRRYDPPAYPGAPDATMDAPRNAPMNVPLNVPVSASMNVPSYSEACLAPQPEIRVPQEMGNDTEGSCASRERLLPQEEPPPPYPGPEYMVTDLPPPPSYDEVTK